MKLLEKRIEPDLEGLLAVIKRQKTPERVFNIELFLDDEITEKICDQFSLAKDISPDAPFSYYERKIRTHRFLGYEAIHIGFVIEPFKYGKRLSTQDTTQQNDQSRQQRDWMDEHTGPIQNWQDFDTYPWPKVSEIDFSALDWLEKNIPDDMGFYDLTAHILEGITNLIGYESL
ncbi:unnamed protein product, partial [marine sediment metagenome]